VLCQGREGCELISSLDAGTDEEGNQLNVIEASTPQLLFADAPVFVSSAVLCDDLR